MISAFGVNHPESVSKVNPFTAKKQVASQMKLVSETGNKVLKPSSKFPHSGVIHNSPSMKPQKAGDSVKTVKLNMAGTQARKKFGNG